MRCGLVRGLSELGARLVFGSILNLGIILNNAARVWRLGAHGHVTLRCLPLR
jgi:hypothetical protein